MMINKVENTEINREVLYPQLFKTTPWVILIINLLFNYSITILPLFIIGLDMKNLKNINNLILIIILIIIFIYKVIVMIMYKVSFMRAKRGTLKNYSYLFSYFFAKCRLALFFPFFFTMIGVTSFVTNNLSYFSKHSNLLIFFVILVLISYFMFELLNIYSLKMLAKDIVANQAFLKKFILVAAIVGGVGRGILYILELIFLKENRVVAVQQEMNMNQLFFMLVVFILLGCTFLLGGNFMKMLNYREKTQGLNIFQMQLLFDKKLYQDTYLKWKEEQDRDKK